MTNRIVSKRELSLWGAVYFGALLVALILAVIFVPRANAATSGKKFVVEQRDYWSMTRSYTAPNAVGIGTHIETYIVSVATNYYRWPGSPDGVGRIAVKGGSVCYSRIAGNNSLFQGITVNPYYEDDNDVVNPGLVSVDSDGTAYNCVDFTIAAANRTWFRMDQDPGWQAAGKVRIQLHSDDEFDFKWSGNTTKYFHPGDDPEVDEWTYIDGAYGGH